MRKENLSMEPAFNLRSREAEWVEQESVVAGALADFSRPARDEGEASPRTRAELLWRYAAATDLFLVDAYARANQQFERLAPGRVVISCESARFGIPTGQRESPLDDWSGVLPLHGELIELDDGGLERVSVSIQLRRALLAVAGSVPLLLSPVLAHAGGGPAWTDAAQGVTQLSRSFAPPSLPEDAQSPTPTPGAEEGPLVPVGGSVTPRGTGTTLAPPVQVPPPELGDSLSLNGRTLWEGLLDKEVILAMREGQTLEGRVVAQTHAELALARSSDGMVVAVAKAEIAAVRLAAMAGAGASLGIGAVYLRPRKDGHVLFAGGVVVATFGSIATVSGLVMTGFGAFSPFLLVIGLPLLIPGLATLGGSAAMLVKAKKRRRAFRSAWGAPAQARLKISPTFKLGRLGGQAGLVLRF